MSIIPTTLLLCFHALPSQCPYCCYLNCNGHSCLYWWQLLMWVTLRLESHIATSDWSAQGIGYFLEYCVYHCFVNLWKVEAWWGERSTPVSSWTGATFCSNDTSIAYHKEMPLILQVPRGGSQPCAILKFTFSCPSINYSSWYNGSNKTIIM